MEISNQNNFDEIYRLEPTFPVFNLYTENTTIRLMEFQHCKLFVFSKQYTHVCVHSHYTDQVHCYDSTSI